MRRIFLVLLLFLPLLAMGQTTTVTLQVTDTPDNQSWNNGTWTVNGLSLNGVISQNFFVGGVVVPNQQQSGSLSGTGGATFTLTPNASIGPAGSLWSITVCPLATWPCSTSLVTIQGATQTLTLTPSSVRVTNVNNLPFAKAYADTEISNISNGTIYYNIPGGLFRYYNGVWNNLTGSGGSGTPCTTTANSVQFNSSGSFGCVTQFTYAGNVLTVASGGTQTFSSGAGFNATALAVSGTFLGPNGAGYAPTTDGTFGVNTSSHAFVFGCNGSTCTALFNGGALGTPNSGTLTNATGYLWNNLASSTGALTLNNGVNSTTWNQTSNTPFSWVNTTVGTVSSTNGSPTQVLQANYWTGSVSAADSWTEALTLVAGSNGASTLGFTHSGSTGLALVSVPNLTLTSLTGSTNPLCIPTTGGAVTNVGCSGGGSVASVSNSDGTLTISPTTGAVVASLALGHANTWSGVQTIPNTDLILSGITSSLFIGTNSTGNPILATSTANSLAGFNSSGNGSDVTIGSGLSLSSGVLSATGSGFSLEVNGGSALVSPVTFNNGTSGNLINFSNPSGSIVQATCPLCLFDAGASDVTGQSTSQSAVTLATAPTAGRYQITYYADLNTPCTAGTNSVNFTFNWSDGTTARTQTTGVLSMASANTSGSYLSGILPLQVGSSNVTYTSTVNGTCSTGTSTYDVHVALVRVQ